MTIRETSQHVTGALQHTLIALCALVTLLVLGWLLKYRPHGIDFTDESFYLVWISNPFIYDVSITQHLGPLFRERASWLLAVPIALGVQAVTATLLQTEFEQPYRQTQPLRLNASVLEVRPQRSLLVLSEGYAEHIAGAARAAREAGFQPTSPMIDLPGQSR